MENQITLLSTSKVCKIEEKVIEALKSIKEDILPYNKICITERTYIINTKLAQMGNACGYDVCVNKNHCGGDHQSEWLYDMVWYKENSDNMLIEVPLVLEMEWSRFDKDIKYDFEKLLLSNSELRVMIFQKDSRDEVQKIGNNLIDRIKIFENKNKADKYLLIGMDTTGDGAFYIKPYHGE
ncbi:MAG: hypothetical protein Q8903_00260 [Bacteroidota bacterium]|nr:hypothetical protein [Bacteroidota bacterium]